MQRDYNTSGPVKVRKDGKFLLEGLRSVAFSLQPRSDRGFPVSVRVDGGDPFTVDSADVMPQAGAFTRVEVDVLPGKGQPGDEWDVRLYPDAASIPVLKPKTDERGNLTTAPAASNTLFSFDYSVKEQLGALRAGLQHTTQGEDIHYAIVNPAAPDSLLKRVYNGNLSSRVFPAGFDLTRYRCVQLFVEADVASEGNYRDPFANTVVTVFFATVNPDGGLLLNQVNVAALSNGASTNGGVLATLTLGGGERVDLTNEKVRALPASGHFGFYVEGSPAMEANDGEYRLKISAVGY